MEYSHSNIKVLYRCYIDPFGNPGPKDGIMQFAPVIEYEEFRVTAHTPCGFKIEAYGKTKFVLRGEGKRFAHESKKQAYISKLRRTERRLYILKNHITFCEKELSFLKNNPVEKQ